MKLDWIPEKYPPSGTIGAAGFYKLLGRPQLDPLTVLVRETAQNSWDAKKPRVKAVRFRIDARGLDQSERAILLNSVLPQRELARGTGLDDLADGCTAMYITDRGTVGLGGPISASDVSADNVYDWVDFVLNVGKANTQGHSGGTYGFGKTIAYVVSAANTVVVYSRSKNHGAYQSRLMACAIGSEFKHEGALYTGRHWWGRNDAGAPAPILNADADALAAELGMPAFTAKETGTTLMIVQPDFGGRTPEQGMRFIAEAALWNLWPKLVPLAGGEPEMSVSLTWDGVRIPVPPPESRPPLGGFVQALQELVVDRPQEERPPGIRIDSIRIERPKRVVGTLATVPLLTRDRATVDDGYSPEGVDSPRPAAMIDGSSHHVALIRSPNLVVEYLEGPPSPEPNFEWAGVFKASYEEDHVFAMAEPPTHDSWRPDLIPDRTGKSIVKMTLQNVRRALDDRWGTRDRSSDSPAVSTSTLAHRLAHLVAGAPGTAAIRTERQRDPGVRRTQPKIEIVSSGPIGDGSEMLTQISLLLSPASGAARTELSVAIGIALAGGGVDHTSDSGLALRTIEIDGAITPLTGMSAILAIDGDKSVVITIVAVRTTDFSVSFELDATDTRNR